MENLQLCRGRLFIKCYVTPAHVGTQTSVNVPFVVSYLPCEGCLSLLMSLYDEESANQRMQYVLKCMSSMCADLNTLQYLVLSKLTNPLFKSHFKHSLLDAEIHVCVDVCRSCVETSN